MSRTRDTIEFLRYENKELKEEVKQLKEQIEYTQFLVEFGKDNIDIKFGTSDIGPVPTKFPEIVVRYAYDCKILTTKKYIKRELFDKIHKNNYEVRVLLNTPQYLIFDVIVVCPNCTKLIDESTTFMINKRSNELIDYPCVGTRIGSK